MIINTNKAKGTYLLTGIQMFSEVLMHAMEIFYFKGCNQNIISGVCILPLPLRNS